MQSKMSRNFTFHPLHLHIVGVLIVIVTGYGNRKRPDPHFSAGSRPILETQIFLIGISYSKVEQYNNFVKGEGMKNHNFYLLFLYFPPIPPLPPLLSNISSFFTLFNFPL